MKKISKFRAWLIRKLGGELPAYYRPVIFEKRVPTETLECRISFTQDEVYWLNHMFPDGGENEVKKRLWNGFMEKASPFVDIRCDKNTDLNTVDCKARLTIVKTVSKSEVSIKSVEEVEEYKPTCPRGYTDCVWDPAYIKHKYPSWYARLYGDKTPEEAAHEKNGCYDRFKEDPDEKYYCYDDEDK